MNEAPHDERTYARDLRFWSGGRAARPPRSRSRGIPALRVEVRPCRGISSRRRRPVRSEDDPRASGGVAGSGVETNALDWWIDLALDRSGRTDPFQLIHNQLFRIVVDYNNDRTEGMTDADMVEAISALSGAPVKRTAEPFVRHHASRSNRPRLWPDGEMGRCPVRCGAVSNLVVPGSVPADRDRCRAR